MTEYIGVIAKKEYLGSGNSKQRRKLRRYLNRVVIPLVEKNTPLIEIAFIAEVRFQTLYKFLTLEGYVRSAWMYRKVQKEKS